MAEIDRLEVQVEAQATKANSELDKLVEKLTKVADSLVGINSSGLTGLANGVQKFAQASAGLSNVRTADFTRLAKNIQSISSLNTSQMYGTASAMTAIAKSMGVMGTASTSSIQIADMAKNIAKLGGVNVQRAIANLPQLEKALSNFIDTMSKAPAVSKNVIQMTNSLAELASQGSKVGTAANTISKAMNTQAKSTERVSKSSKGLASALGSLYQKYFWLSRGIQKAWSSVETSMDFLETVNYFEVAMRQIGDSAASTWSENGYASAEAYAQSFTERAKELTAKMTGYKIDENGNAAYIGMKNLGMDPDAVLNYQAVFAQVSSSIGVAEESSLNFSKALTMLGADWASLRNLTFEQSWGKFASALAGQSRAVRSLGIDITNATLQEYAYKYGLEQAIQEMNQATKAQLRLLAILDQSEVAFGDLANTIGSPANQVRMLQQNMSNLARVIGNLFLPVVQNVLPYVNGLVIAFQNLFSWVGGLLGIKFDAINSSMGGMSDEMADLVGGAEDYEDALDGANSAAKKLKNNLQGWHEINNITTQDTSSSGGNTVGGGSPVLDSAISDALADYEKAWNEAFENMENKAQEFADRISKSLEPLKKIINDFAIGDFFQAGKDTSLLVAGIFDFVAEAIDKVDWYGIGQKIGDFLAGIDWIKVLSSFGNMLWQGIKGVIELGAGMFSAAPIETTIVAIATMPNLLKAIVTGKFVSGLSSLIKKFTAFGDTTIITAQALFGNKNAANALATFYPKLNTKITKLSKSFKGGLGKTVENVRNNMTTMQKGMVGAVAVFGEFTLLKDAFYDLASGSDNVVESLLKIVGGAGAASAALYVAFGPAGLAVAAVTGVAAAIMGVNEAVEESRIQFAETVVFDNYGMKVGEISGLLSNLWSDMSDANQKTIELRDTIEGNNEKISEAAEALGGYADKIRATGGISAEEATAMSGDVDGLASALKDNLKYNTELAFDTFMTMSGDAAKQLGVDVEAMTGILSAFQTRFSGITDALQADIDAYISKIANGGKLDGTEFADLEQKINDLRDLSGAAYANQEELNRKLREMADIDFGSTEEATKAINDIKELGVGMATEAKTAYELSLRSFNEQIGTIKAAMDQELITEEEAAEYLAIFTSAKKGLEANYKTEIGQIETQINTAYEYIGAQLDKAGAKVYEEAHNKFSTLNPFEQFFNVNADRYATKTYETGFYNNIKKPIQGAMELVKGDLAEYGINTADAFSSNMMDAWATCSYDYETLGSDAVAGYIKGINEKENAAIEAFKSMVEIGLEGAKSSAIPENYGKNTVKGFNSGITNNIGLTEDTIETWMDDTETAIHDSAMNFGSPSKTAIEFGRNTVLGYNLGISENTDSTITTVEKYINKAITTFSCIIEQMTLIGSQAMQGFNVGMDGMSGDIIKKAQNIADSVSETFRKALDIHSPSRVMFSLGEYTMEGYQLGAESMFANLKKSFGKYTANTVDMFKSNLDYASINASIERGNAINNECFASIGSTMDMYETNMLLRELVEAAKKGKVIYMNSREVGREIAREDKELFLRTGRGIFEH